MYEKLKKKCCECRHPQYHFTLTSFLFFLIKSDSYNSKKKKKQSTILMFILIIVWLQN